MRVLFIFKALCHVDALRECERFLYLWLFTLFFRVRCHTFRSCVVRDFVLKMLKSPSLCLSTGRRRRAALPGPAATTHSILINIDLSPLTVPPLPAASSFSLLLCPLLPAHNLTSFSISFHFLCNSSSSCNLYAYFFLFFDVLLTQYFALFFCSLKL